MVPRMRMEGFILGTTTWLLCVCCLIDDGGVDSGGLGDESDNDDNSGGMQGVYYRTFNGISSDFSHPHIFMLMPNCFSESGTLRDDTDADIYSDTSSMTGVSGYGSSVGSKGTRSTG